MRVIEYLRDHSLAQLREEHAVNARVCEARPYKVSLNYDQIEARDENPIAQECRALILRTANGLAIDPTRPLGNAVVMARAFDRFFNHGQGAASSIDMERARVQEKLDGSLCVVHFDDIAGAWHVATRSVCEADMNVNGGGLTFRGLFELALREAHGLSWVAFTERLDEWQTYAFELTAPENRIVVDHQRRGVTLIGCRDTRTGFESWPHAIDIGLPVVESMRLPSLDDVLAYVRDRDPKKHEGVVLVEERAPGRFARVKIKNADYLALSRMKDALGSPRAIMSLILSARLDDALPLMGDFDRARAERVAARVGAKLHAHASAYERLCARIGGEHGSREHRKAFAIAGRSEPGLWFEVAMAQYTGGCASAAEYIDAKRSATGEYPHALTDQLLAECGWNEVSA